MPGMFDVHTHTTLSDGALCPAEMIRRAEVAGYAGFALTDHADIGTVDLIVPRLVEAAAWENRLNRLLVVPGAEITHVRPEHIGEVAERARRAGALLVLCHGESLAEPVQKGTNRAGIEAGVDVLAHPGLLSLEDAKRAAAKNVALELTAKAGHGYTNGHVARVARECGARLVFGTDGHLPEHLKTREQALDILRGAGLSPEEADKVLAESERLLRAKDASRASRDDAM